MPRSKTQLVTFNRGLVSPLGIARVDLERTAMSAETMTNWMPRNLGSMMLRPGTGYIGSTQKTVAENIADGNLLTAPSELSNAAWTAVNGLTVNDDTTVDPDGTTTADTLTDANAAAGSLARQTLTGIDGTVEYTFSAYILKDGTGRATRFPSIRIVFDGSTREDNELFIDTSTGEYSQGDDESGVTSVDVVSHSATWWLATIVVASNDTLNDEIDAELFPTRGSGAGWTVDNTDTGSAIFWGVQLYTGPQINLTANGKPARFIPFIFAADDTALIELTDSLMRVWVDDALVTRPSVSTTITNGDFTSGSGGWTDNDEVGGASTMNVAVGSERYLQLEGDGTNAAIRTQEVTVAVGDQGVEHGLLVEVGFLGYTGDVYNAHKPTLRIGSTEGGDDYVAEVRLDSGHHHFAFTPTGNFWIEWSNREDGHANVRTTDIDSSGVVSITTLWGEADLPNIRYDQSGDIIYLACDGIPPCKILRYDSGSRSWGVALYEPINGPFETINAGPKELSATTAAGSGSNVTSGTADFWKSTDKGRLVRIDSVGQRAAATVTGADQWTTTYIKVTGVTATRIFTVRILDTWVGTISLQRSMTDPNQTANWEEVNTWTGNTTETYDDTLDNQTAWYRIGFDTGNYTSGQAQVFLEYEHGSSIGVARIWNVASTTSVSTITLIPFGNTTASKSWYLGAWSETTGYPTTVAFSEGRLCWAGKNKAWLSASDDYESFDIETIGDSGPITRTIASGSVDAVNWMLGLRRLLMGTATREHVMRSSSEDEPLTPTNALLKDYGTQGSAKVHALKLDNAGLYVQRGGIRLMETAFGGNFEYETSDLTTFNPEIGSPGITHIALQRQPDSRVHCVRSDGTVAVLLHDPAENITCWVELTVPGTSAAVEDVVVLPGADGSGEDAVYYVVARTVNGVPARFLERWSLESENQGGTLNKQVDAHITGTVTGGVLTGLTHLEGEEVAVWVNGVDAGTYTVSSGQITSVTSDGSAVAGLSYTAQFKSAKLGELLEKRNLSRLGVILYNTHYQGLKYGDAFDNLDDLPLVKDGTTTADDTIHAGYDEENFSFDGVWDTDARLCLQAESPRPCTLLAAIVVTED